MQPANTDRVQSIIKERALTVEEYLSLPSTKEACLEAIQRQQPRVKVLHEAVCRCTANIFWNENVPQNLSGILSPMRSGLDKTVKTILCIQLGGPIDETSPIIQIVALRTIDAVLKQNRAQQ